MAISGATRYLQHWILARAYMLHGSSVWLTYLMTCIFNFQRSRSGFSVSFLKYPFIKGWMASTIFMGLHIKFWKNFFPGKTKKPLRNLKWLRKGYRMVLFGFLYFTLWQSVSNERDRQDKRRYCYPQMPKSCSRGCPRSCPIKTKKGELSPSCPR